jgi:hypothetical protein
VKDPLTSQQSKSTSETTVAEENKTREHRTKYLSIPLLIRDLCRVTIILVQANRKPTTHIIVPDQMQNNILPLKEERTMSVEAVFLSWPSDSIISSSFLRSISSYVTSFFDLKSSIHSYRLRTHPMRSCLDRNTSSLFSPL